MIGLLPRHTFCRMRVKGDCTIRPCASA